MCIAIFKPQDVKIKKDVLQYCYNQNPHGAGFAVPQNGVMIIKKGFFSFRSFWLEYREFADLGLPMLIHFRVATSGIINGENCHPWRIDEKHALIHNGVLEQKLGLCHDDVSDTGLFVHNLLKPTIASSEEIWQSNGFKWMVEESIGSGNKIVVLNADGKHVIFNEGKGEWSDGAWFSNNTFKEERKKKPGTTVLTQTKYYGTPTTKKMELGVPIYHETDIVNKVPPPHFYKKDDEESPVVEVGATIPEIDPADISCCT